jgi:hypothetical protein
MAKPKTTFKGAASAISKKRGISPKAAKVMLITEIKEADALKKNKKK